MDNCNRVKRVYVNSSLILAVLNFYDGGAECIYVPMMSCFPAGARITQVSYVAERRSWMLVVEHESFDEVPDGEMIPEPDGLSPFECVTLNRGEDGAFRLAREVERGEASEQYRSTLGYVLENLQARGDEGLDPASDELLIQQIEGILTKDTLREAVEYSRAARQRCIGGIEKLKRFRVEAERDLAREAEVAFLASYKRVCDMVNPGGHECFEVTEGNVKRLVATNKLLTSQSERLADRLRQWPKALMEAREVERKATVKACRESVEKRLAELAREGQT